MLKFAVIAGPQNMNEYRQTYTMNLLKTVSLKGFIYIYIR